MTRELTLGTGGTGRTGSRIVRRLTARGGPVRNPRPTEGVQQLLGWPAADHVRRSAGARS